MADRETLGQAARRILDAPFTWPDGHILNEGITPVGNIKCSMMLCGSVQVLCDDGSFLPAMEVYTMSELDHLRADIAKGRPMCSQCLEASGL